MTDKDTQNSTSEPVDGLVSCANPLCDVRFKRLNRNHEYCEPFCKDSLHKKAHEIGLELLVGSRCRTCNGRAVICKNILKGVEYIKPCPDCAGTGVSFEYLETLQEKVEYYMGLLCGVQHLKEITIKGENSLEGEKLRGFAQEPGKWARVEIESESGLVQSVVYTDVPFTSEATIKKGAKD